MSEKKELTSDLVRITRWSQSSELLRTQYGYIQFLDWLKKEKDRIESKSESKLEIRQDDEGKVAFFSGRNI